MLNAFRTSQPCNHPYKHPYNYHGNQYGIHGNQYGIAFPVFLGIWNRCSMLSEKEHSMSSNCCIVPVCVTLPYTYNTSSPSLASIIDQATRSGAGGSGIGMNSRVFGLGLNTCSTRSTRAAEEVLAWALQTVWGQEIAIRLVIEHIEEHMEQSETCETLEDGDPKPKTGLALANKATNANMRDDVVSCRWV